MSERSAMRKPRVFVDADVLFAGAASPQRTRGQPAHSASGRIDPYRSGKELEGQVTRSAPPFFVCW